MCNTILICLTIVCICYMILVSMGANGVKRLIQRNTEPKEITYLDWEKSSLGGCKSGILISNVLRIRNDVD